jgi:uncharacterized membrane protein
MFKRLISFGLILLGAAVSVFSLVADPLGFGAAPNVVGWKQLTGAFVGVFIAIFGLWLNQSAAQTQPKSDEQSKGGKEVLK